MALDCVVLFFFPVDLSFMAYCVRTRKSVGIFLHKHNGEDFLRKLRGKSILFVGDILSLIKIITSGIINFISCFLMHNT